MARNTPRIGSIVRWMVIVWEAEDGHHDAIYNSKPCRSYKRARAFASKHAHTRWVLIRRMRW